MNLHALILAGGRGERFWPLSRRQRPKQAIHLLGEETLLEETLRRVMRQIPAPRLWLAVGAEHRAILQLLSLPVQEERYLWETVGRNTAAAIGGAVEKILLEGDSDLLVLPSDHWIPEENSFWEAVAAGRPLLEEPDRLVTFGIAPSYAETGYGYIERGEPLDAEGRSFQVARFHEKPGREHALAYVESGRCYWNSGIFLFRVSTMARLLRRHVPEMAGPLDRLRADLAQRESEEVWTRYLRDCPSISIDHGVFERAEKVAVVEARFAWSDLGSWTAWGEFQEPDASGNRCQGQVLAREAEGCVLYSEDGGLLAVLGVRDLIVVRVGDATLVCPKDRAQQIRELVREGQANEALRRFF